MTDRRDQRPDHVDELDDDPRQPQEGVRILGAEEAAAALEGGQVARRLGDDAPRFGDVPPRPDPSVRPAARFPKAGSDDGDDLVRPKVSAEPATGAAPAAGAGGVDVDTSGDALAAADDAATWNAANASEPEPEPEVEVVIDVSEDAGEPSGSLPLPHWTEPPTGEVPIILPEAELVDDVEASAEDLDAWRSASGGGPRFRSGAGDWSEADFADAEHFKEDTAALDALTGTTLDDDAAFDTEVAQRRRRRLRVRGHGGSGDGDGAAAVAPARRPTRPEPEVPEPAAPGSDLATRIITGVGIAVAALICLRLGRGPTAVLAAVIIGFATFEFFEALRKRGFHPATILGLLAAVTTPLAAYKVGEAAFPLMLALVTMFSMLWYLFDVVEARAVVSIAVTLLGYVYIGALGGFAGLLLAYPDGVGLVLGVAICAVAYDVFGYLVGSQFGKTPLMARISPHKTLEGLLGGMTASVLFSAIVVNRITPWTDLGHALSLGVLVAIVAPLGDLCESLLKRDLKLKDFGSVLPGHGGVLDRFDALLFCLPAAYYLARYLKIG